MTLSMTVRLPNDLAQSLDFVANHFERPKNYCFIKAIKSYIEEKMEEIEDAKDGELTLAVLNDPNIELVSWDEAERMAEEIRHV